VNPNRPWGTDLTMIPTLKEPLGLSAVRDAFSRRVAQKHYADQTAAETMNLKPRHPS
jgi:transposase InsO family protein